TPELADQHEFGMAYPRRRRAGPRAMNQPAGRGALPAATGSRTAGVHIHADFGARLPPRCGIFQCTDFGLLTFEWIIGLLLAPGRRTPRAWPPAIPSPPFPAVGGPLFAFSPASPSWTLDPKLALALFVAPVLMDAAYDTSLRDLRANWLPVSTLVIAAV